MPLSLIIRTQGRVAAPPNRQRARHGAGGGKYETPFAFRDNPGNAKSQEKSPSPAPSPLLNCSSKAQELQLPNQRWEKPSSFLHPCRAPPGTAAPARQEAARGGARVPSHPPLLKPSRASPSTSAVLLLLPLTCCSHRHSHPAPGRQLHWIFPVPPPPSNPAEHLHPHVRPLLDTARAGGTATTPTLGISSWLSSWKLGIWDSGCSSSCLIHPEICPNITDPGRKSSFTTVYINSYDLLLKSQPMERIPWEFTNL